MAATGMTRSSTGAARGRERGEANDEKERLDSKLGEENELQRGGRAQASCKHSLIGTANSSTRQRQQRHVSFTAPFVDIDRLRRRCITLCEESMSILNIRFLQLLAQNMSFPSCWPLRQSR